MIALSIRQPWAWLIVNGHKDIENREWPTRFRGRVLIHAGKTMARRYYDEISEQIADMVPTAPPLPAYEALERGGIVGLATITDCVTASESLWFQGIYGFVMRNARPLPFMPVNGKLGFFEIEGLDRDGAQREARS